MRKLIVDCFRLVVLTLAVALIVSAACHANGPQAGVKKLPATGPTLAVCPPTSHVYAPRMTVGVRFFHALPELPVASAIHSRLMSMAVRKPVRRVLAAVVYSHPVRTFAQNRPRVFRWR